MTELRYATLTGLDFERVDQSVWADAQTVSHRSLHRLQSRRAEWDDRFAATAKTQ
jgi:hypothetical protein